ncbi:putative universal stress protein [Novipirellula galeiformis]|uniref:Putative universal stress protein n=1 Tax=Novipirellula galeiformis TaxID=2528004 RepID=A0A5C6CCF2_9BACT|nr:universal stress protein [Novipirellula galeiformis]TWU22280.1 putative universal stress protein [Novipirellula galeiformis]
MRVLAAVDQSEYASFALDCLKRLPCHDEVDLSLLSVAPMVPEYDLSGTAFAMDASVIMKREIELMRKSLNAMVAFAHDEFRSIETSTPIGSPATEIIRFAKEKRADLVLLGATGHSAIARVLLGSVSDTVATHVECSALVVRPQGEQKPEQHAASPAPRRILIAIGDAASDASLTTWVTRFRLPTTTQIHLVHVKPILQFYDEDLFQYASKFREPTPSISEETIATLKSQLQSQGFATRSKLIPAKHIGQTLLEYAQSEKCDLIITGDQHETLIHRIFLGSNSRHVLRHAECSVLISRDVPPSANDPS